MSDERARPAKASRFRGPRSDALVFFGATGDLAFKQGFPALAALTKSGRLEMPVVCVGRKARSHDDAVALVKKSLAAQGNVDAGVLASLARRLSFVAVDFDDPSSFESVRAALGRAEHPLHYLALPPDVFEKTASDLGKARLADGARLVLEKPFGHDARSAQALADALRRWFPEEAVFRIDHYLGKEAVENIVYFRAANPSIEAALHTGVESVQLTMAETFGVAGRTELYDALGAIRDVVQNHLLEVLACLTMDLPETRGEDGLRAARSALLRRVQALGTGDVVRGQVRGYRELEGVDPKSSTETFAALRFTIDSPAWKGVPFFVRAGKSMPVTATELLIRWRPARGPVLDDASPPAATHLRFRIGPDDVIALGANVKKDGAAMAGEPRELAVHIAGGGAMKPYERLLGDAIDGEPALFARLDAVLESWRVVDPVLGDRTPVRPYEPGSWGPAEAAKIVPPGGWREPG